MPSWALVPATQGASPSRLHGRTDPPRPGSRREHRGCCAAATVDRAGAALGLDRCADRFGRLAARPGSCTDRFRTVPRRYRARVPRPNASFSPQKTTRKDGRDHAHPGGSSRQTTMLTTLERWLKEIDGSRPSNLGCSTPLPSGSSHKLSRQTMPSAAWIDAPRVSSSATCSCGVGRLRPRSIDRSRRSLRCGSGSSSVALSPTIRGRARVASRTDRGRSHRSAPTPLMSLSRSSRLILWRSWACAVGDGAVRPHAGRLTDRLPHQRALSASHRRHAHRGASVPHLSRKTEHARRVVPVHGSARPILQQRVARSSDGWVCSGLTPAGPDGKRSWIVVKRFATFCQKVLGPSKQVDVHSFRRCFATYLERASKHTTTVNSSVIAELMGHAKPRSALPYTRQDSDRSNSEPPSRL